MPTIAQSATFRTLELGDGNGLAHAVIELGSLALAFGRVDRITYHEDGTTPESDTDHTVMLGLIACAFAASLNNLPPGDATPYRKAPSVHSGRASDATELPKEVRLDLGKVAQYAMVHDLVEVYAGDTPTLRITSAERASKHEREHSALQRLECEFGDQLPWIPSTIRAYEEQADSEARFVKALDKSLPKITHILNNLTTIRDQGMSGEELRTRYNEQREELSEYASDFPALFALRDELVNIILSRVAERA